ncbi:hypothetical protein [Limosilactobacillus oris]|uniref:hypothetical protein n=1 Tax=Limosilactobacillus oris TaxID=1632 RepID=UPI00195E9B3D|nr:hypothetical protein [Limosilactobacillus oris]VTX69753.1 Uncharacterised protein [Limosilactobacillus oris]
MSKRNQRNSNDIGLLLVRFYFVHKKQVYPKQYAFVTGLTFSKNMLPGTTWEYAATTGNKILWQKIIVVQVDHLQWRPQFNFVSQQEIYLRKLNEKEKAAWEKFSKKHFLAYLSKSKEGEHESKIIGNHSQ